VEKKETKKKGKRTGYEGRRGKSVRKEKEGEGALDDFLPGRPEI